jgi:hypothetical protein
MLNLPVMVELAVACLQVTASLGHSASRHALKIMLADELADRTQGDWAEAFSDVEPTDRRQVEAAALFLVPLTRSANQVLRQKRRRGTEAPRR